MGPQHLNRVNSVWLHSPLNSTTAATTVMLHKKLEDIQHHMGMRLRARSRLSTTAAAKRNSGETTRNSHGQSPLVCYSPHDGAPQLNKNMTWLQLLHY